MKKMMKKVLCSLLVVVLCLTSAPLGGLVELELPNFGELFGVKTSAANYENYFDSGLVDPDTQVILCFDLNGGTIQVPCRVYDDENQQFVIVDGEEVPDPYIMLPPDQTVQLVGQFVTLPYINPPQGYEFDGWFCYQDGLTYARGSAYKIPNGTAGTIIEFYASFKKDPNYIDPKDKHTEGKYTYTLTDDKATIIDVDDSISGDIVIPSTLGGYPVTAIGDEAFAESFNITSVVVPEGVTYIDEDAFALCYRMESVTLPESLETIENWVFGACLSLKEIVLPENVVSINDSAFDSCLSLEKIVVKNAEVVIGEHICYTPLLPKDIPTSEWVEKYITAYEAMMNGDENAETLMAELESHTTILEDEAAVLPEVTIYSHDPSTAKTYAEENGIPFKNISELEEPHTCSFGEWFTETEPTVFSEGVSKRVCECGEFETKPIAKLESASAKDETTKVEITYTEENFETEVSVIVSDEEINANIVFGDEFENYKAFDISLVADGEKVQPKGYVTVKLPIPEGFNADSTVVYYVDDSGNKTKLESTTENGYVIFETNHFSEYVLVDESSKIEPPHQHSYTSAVTKNPTCTEAGVKTFTCSCSDSYTESIPALGHKDANGDYKCDNGCGYEYEKPAPEQPEDPSKGCSCNCHKGGISGFFFKIILFFQKLFKSNQICKCGIKHY